MQPEGELPCSHDPALVSILSLMNEVHISLYIFTIHSNIILLYGPWPMCSKLYKVVLIEDIIICREM
jgi:hypothetical protein